MQWSSPHDRRTQHITIGAMRATDAAIFNCDPLHPGFIASTRVLHGPLLFRMRIGVRRRIDPVVGTGGSTPKDHDDGVSFRWSTHRGPRKRERMTRKTSRGVHWEEWILFHIRWIPGNVFGSSATTNDDQIQNDECTKNLIFAGKNVQETNGIQGTARPS